MQSAAGDDHFPRLASENAMDSDRKRSAQIASSSAVDNK